MNRFAAKTALAGVLATALAISHAAFADEIRWSTDLAAATRQASQEGKLILLHFQSQDCVPCRNLEATVFADPEVVDVLNNAYVPVRVDVDEHPSLAESFQVKSWPTDVVLTPTGTQVFRGVSSQKAVPYRTTLELLAQSSQTETVDPAVAAYERATAQPGQVSATETYEADGYGGGSLGVDGMPAGQGTGQATALYAPPKEEVWEPTGVESSFDPRSAHPPEATLSQSPRDPMDYPRFDSALAGTPQFDGPISSPAPIDRDMTSPQPNPYQQAGFGGSTGPSFDGGYGAAGGGTGSAAETSDVGTEFHATASVPAIPAGFARPAATPAPAASLRLGLQGYCPVTLVAQNARAKGDPQFGVKHRGIVYLFADASAKDLFLSDPDHFSLAWQGIDAVEFVDGGRTVAGDANFGVVAPEYGIDGILLFSSEENLAKFGESEESVRYYAQRMEASLFPSSNVAAAPGTMQR